MNQNQGSKPWEGTASFLGSTTMRRGESFCERRSRMRYAKGITNGVKVSVRAGDGGRIRKSSRMCSYRLNVNGVCSEHLFCRTEVKVVDKGTGMSLKKRHANLIASRALGKYRVQCTFSGASRRLADEEVNRRRSNAVECIEEITVDGGNRALKSGRAVMSSRRRNDVSRNRMECKESRAAKRKSVKRNRKRRMVSVESFILFNVQTGAQVGRAIGSEGERNGGLNEVDKFKRSVDECRQCLSKLYTTWADVPFFRCSGGSRRNPKFSCVSTLRFVNKHEVEHTVFTVLLSLVIEEEGRRIRNLTMRQEKKFDTDGECREETNCILCSCSVDLSDGGMKESSCWHVGALKSDATFVSNAMNVMEHGFDPDHDLYFGDVLDVNSCRNGNEDSRLNEAIGEGCFLDMDELRRGLVAIQLDDLTKEHLVRRGTTVGKRWSVWSVIDLKHRVNVTVIWRAVSSGVDRTRMCCATCRHDRSRSCRHELACEAESILRIHEKDSSGSEYGSENDSGRTVGNETDVPAQDENGHESNDAIHSFNEGPEAGDDHDGRMEGVSEEREVEKSNEKSKSVGGEPPSGPVLYRVDQKPESFYPRRVKRSFMLCVKEKQISEELAELIETDVAGDGTLMFCDRDGLTCRGILMDRKGERFSCKGTRKKGVDDKARRMTIFTLNHGEMTIVVVDWVCAVCQHLNRFEGTSSGLFPISYGVGYTVELLYWWLSEMCSTTNSFRSVYHTSRKFRYTPSYTYRLESGRLNTLAGRHKSSRRDGNDAMREFIKCIDLDRKEMSGQLYSCQRCEVEMTADDIKQLGMESTQCEGMKRLSGVVVDAKVVPLLKDVGGSGDVHATLHATTGLHPRIVSNTPTKNAVRLFLKTTRACIAKSRRSEFRTVEDAHLKDYGVRDGFLYVRLGAMKNHAKTKVQSRRTNIIQYIGIIRWYIEPQSCLCRGLHRTLTMNHDECAETRASLETTQGKETVRGFLRALFEIVPPPEWVVSSAANGRRTEEDPDDGDGGDSGEEADEGGDSGHSDNFGVDDAWVRTRQRGFLEVEDQLDSVLELGAFCLLEAISLGFFPFRGADGTADTETLVHDDGGVDGDSDREGIESRTAQHEASDFVKNLAPESVKLHETVANSLHQISTCTHRVRHPADSNNVLWACSPCTELATLYQETIHCQNAILGRYIRNLLLNGPRTPHFSKNAAGAVSKLLMDRVRHFEKYLVTMGRKMHITSLEYWKRYGTVTGLDTTTGIENDDGNSDESLYVFPGRKRCRSGITFDRHDKQDCTKNYFKGTSNIPSFLTVQCSCRHPKLLGFVILQECESISAALSSVMTHFAIPPRRIWYDNACNTFDCAVTRVPWFLRWTTFMVDRFHYTGHTCSNMFNGTMHPTLDDDRSNTAEALNSVLDKAATHIAYLKGSNVIPFVRVLFAHMNGASHVRDHVKTDDLEDEDVHGLFRELFTCTCHLCDTTQDNIVRDNSNNGTTVLRNLISIFTTDNTEVSLPAT